MRGSWHERGDCSLWLWMWDDAMVRLCCFGACIFWRCRQKYVHVKITLCYFKIIQKGELTN